MAAKRMTKAEKAARAMVEKAFYATINGRVIPMMAIPAIYRAGSEAAAACAMLPLSSEETMEIVKEAVGNAIAKVAVAA